MCVAIQNSCTINVKYQSITTDSVTSISLLRKELSVKDSFKKREKKKRSDSDAAFVLLHTFAIYSKGSGIMDIISL